MKGTFFTVAVLALLTGCDGARELAAKVAGDGKPTTLAIRAGYQVQIDGKAAPIYGTSACPPAGELTLFGPGPDEGNRTCVVVGPETKTVTVLVGGGAIPQPETWLVDHDGSKTMLRRPDGSYIVAAK